MTYLEQESLDYFSRIKSKASTSTKNDYQLGYDAGFKGLAHRGKTKLYNEGFRAGRVFGDRV